MKLKNYLIIGAVVLLLGLGFWAGWYSHSALRPCPEITTDTIITVDSTWYHLADSLLNLPPKEIIKWLPQDTLFIPGDTFLIDVDTAAILKDYYSVYSYLWEKQDTNLQVNLKTTVTRNMPIAYELDYKLLKPSQTIINNIDNSITYNSYIQASLYIPVYNVKDATFNNINNTRIELSYTYSKGVFGVGWQPINNTFGIKAGTTIFKFRKRK